MAIRTILHRVIRVAMLLAKAVCAIPSLIKRALIKHWSKEIANGIRRDLVGNADNHDCKNAAGLGGTEFHPAFVSWDTLLKQSKSAELRRWAGNPLVIREHFFFAYFGPLESWCDKNTSGKYYLWTSNAGVYRQFTDPLDHVLWKMSWESSMPTLAEIDQITG